MSIVMDYRILTDFCKKALESCGMNDSDSSQMAELLVKGDMWGLHTHGTKNLYGYILKAKHGGVSFTAKPVTEKELPSAVLIDGKDTMGYISGVIAMNRAVELAQKTGIAMALVKNSCHFGATGCYSNIAAERGMIGFAATNVDRKMGIPGAQGMVIGNNPFSFAAPATIIPSVILDISSSNVATLKVLKEKAQGHTVPDGWITDKDGLPTNDPAEFPDEGALIPMGNHKGYGIAMFVEIMTSVLLGQATSTTDDVPSWCFDLEERNNICHIFIAIDTQAFAPGDFKKRVDAFIEDIHRAPKAKGAERITVPGENMWKHYHESKEHGLNLPDDVVKFLRLTAEKTGVAFPPDVR